MTPSAPAEEEVSHARSRGRWVSPLIPAVAFVLLSLFYFLTAPGNPTEADDALWYAHDVETATWPELWHPYHLLYLPVGRLFWGFTRAIGLVDRAYPALILMGAMFSAAAVVVVWDLLRRRLGIEPLRAAVASGCLAVTYGVWRYAAEAEIYAMALLVTAGLTHLALARKASHGLGLAVILLGAIAPFVHILAVLVSAIAVPVGILRQRGIRAAATYAVVTAVLGLVIGTAGMSAAGGSGSVVDFYRSDKPTVSVGGGTGAIRHGIAASQALVSGNFLLTYPSVRRELGDRFPDRMLEDELYAGRSAPQLIGRLAPFTLLALFAGGVWLLASHRRTRVDWMYTRRSAAWFAGSWLLAHVATLVAFARPGQPESWMLAILPTWLLVVCWLVWDQTKLAPLTFFAGALALHNGIGGFGVYADEDGDRYRARASWVIAEADSTDAILTAESAGLTRHLTYYGAAEVVDFQFTTPREIRAKIGRIRDVPGQVYAMSDIFDPPAHYRNLFPELADSLARITAEVRGQFVRVHSDSLGAVYRWDEREPR